MALQCTVLSPSCLPIIVVLAAAAAGSKCWLDAVIQHAHYQAFLPNFQACLAFSLFHSPIDREYLLIIITACFKAQHTAGSVFALRIFWMVLSALQAVLVLFSILQILSITAFPIDLPIDTKLLSPLARRQEGNTGIPSITALPDYVLQYAPVMYLHSEEKW